MKTNQGPAIENLTMKWDIVNRNKNHRPSRAPQQVEGDAHCCRLGQGPAEEVRGGRSRHRPGSREGLWGPRPVRPGPSGQGGSMTRQDWQGGQPACRTAWAVGSLHSSPGAMGGPRGRGQGPRSHPPISHHHPLQVGRRQEGQSLSPFHGTQGLRQGQGSGQNLANG